MRTPSVPLARSSPMIRLLLTVCLTAPAVAQDWPNWRGPHHNGSSDVEGLPGAIDAEGGIRWRVPLPGPGASTPVVIGDRIFLTSADLEADVLVAFCLDAKTGKELWSKPAGSGYKPAGKGSGTSLGNRSNYASPSPVSDGERVVFFFGNGDLVTYDLEGEELWRRNLQKDYGDFAFQWTFSASPTLWEGRLVLPILQRDEPANGLGEKGAPSFLLGLDVTDGKELYRSVRPSAAVKESLESYATAIPYVGDGGRKELLVIGGDVITGHDPASGEELWRWGTWNEGHREVWWRVVPSAVVGGGVALVCAPKKAPVYAVRLGGEGLLGQDGLAWRSEGRPNPVSSDVPTPLFYQDAFFVASDVREALSKVKPADGSVLWTTELPGKDRWRGSPTGADGRVWMVNHGGLLVAVDAGTGKIVLQAALGTPDDDQVRASVTAAAGALFVRLEEELVCVGS